MNKQDAMEAISTVMDDIENFEIWDKEDESNWTEMHSSLLLVLNYIKNMDSEK